MSQSKIVKCPYCNEQSQVTEKHQKELEKYGKTCFSCDKCDKLFTLRDDGDGEYVMYPRSK